MRKEAKSVRKFLQLIVILVFLAFVAGAGIYFQSREDKSGNTLSDEAFGWKYPVTKFPLVGPETTQLAYSNIRDPGGISEGLPIRLKIPAIGVNSAIEDALITPDGRMDVPSGSVNVAWFALGPHPGKVGSAVIGGHFGIDSGVPKVFYNLDKLKAGDKVYIEDDKGVTLAFIVRRIELFDRNADATTVFTSNDGLAHLNLITCEGIWNQVNDTYPSRRVVFTDSIPGEGGITITPLLPKAALTIPKSSSLPSPSESSVPAPALNDSPMPKNLKNSPDSPQILIASGKSLYATPADGLITSFLLIGIVFVAFKIIRR